MYINKPKISLVVVINGPVANAGSILNRFKVKGTKAPNIEAKIITINKAMLTAKVRAKLLETKKLYTKAIDDNDKLRVRET